jgi:hypothetical protein
MAFNASMLSATEHLRQPAVKVMVDRKKHALRPRRSEKRPYSG